MTKTNEVKHTPGPWEVNGDRDSDDGLTVEARSGEVCFIAETLGYGKADIANAFLIAAAPDLFEAVEYFMDMLIEDKPDIEMEKNAIKVAYNKGRAALEKAVQKGGE